MPFFRSSEPPRLHERLPVGLGLEVSDGEVFFFFPAGTPLPAEHSEVFTPGPGHAELELTFYAGLEPDIRTSSRIGRARIAGPPTLAGAQVKVTFTADEYGDLHVAAEAGAAEIQVKRKLQSSADYLSDHRLRKLRAHRQ